ncbi:MAG: SGNH/GDSL hydrolase family protein, partial [Planctomycetota bacterium]
MSLAAAEGMVRLVGRTDADGQFFVRDRPLRPHRLPTRRLNRFLAHYRRNESEAAIRYDPKLGWIPRPRHRSANGLRNTNAAGIRGTVEYASVPGPGALRIAVFGDSYTYGAEVRDEDSWPRVLERDLGERGIPTEVLNFGVGAYGMGQAYLRWRILGRR